MTTGFRNSAGTDFDSLFAPYQGGFKPAATSYKTSDGVDLVNRYEPLASGTMIPTDTGFKIASGADCRTLWCAIGTTFELWTANCSSGTGASTEAIITLNIKTNGDVEFAATRTVGAGRIGSVNAGSGDYYVPNTPGIGSNYEARVTANINGIKSPAASAQALGKGGISYTPIGAPGNSASVDTGWQDPDDATYFLRMRCASTGNNGAGIFDGDATVQVREKIGGAIIYTKNLAFDCIADSQL